MLAKHKCIVSLKTKVVFFNPSGLDTGFGGLSVFDLETELFAGPDGLPVKTQVFSGETLPIDIK